MPFGESFLTSIKSNKSIMLDKSNRFRRTLGGFDTSKTNQFDFPKVTPEVLSGIRHKIKKQQRKLNVIIALGFVFLAVTFLACILCSDFF